MKRVIASLISVAMAVTVGWGAFADEKGDQVATKHFALKKSDDSTGTAQMTITDKSGSKRLRKLEMFTKEGSDGTISFIRFIEPADVNGTKFLTIPHKGGDSDQRIYLPASKKTRKIASSSSDKSGEFVQSDLFYYDMESRDFEDYTYTFISENETLADPAFAGMKFYKIEMKAKSSSSPYAKTVTWVNQDNYFAYKLDVFDKKDNALWKTITFPKVELIKGVLIPTQTLVVNHKKNSKTSMQMDNIKVNTGLKDDVFSVKNLEQ